MVAERRRTEGTQFIWEGGEKLRRTVKQSVCMGGYVYECLGGLSVCVGDLDLHGPSD